MKLVNQVLLPCLLSSSAFIVDAQEKVKDDIETMKVVAKIKDNNDQRIKKPSIATKTFFDIKDIPQTINSFSLQQEEIYGQNDLSIIVNKLPEVDATYDMRDEGVKIGGFSVRLIN
ncbi:hypothetical protein J3U21_00075 [Gilliamella sp. B2776]|uniref:hypothetical protein n=1 Tax=unclassified Gilliamella TaxID=2685620 RepID=UPI0022699180|nr:MULTISPECIES: hypothetical protein [unclassified Gilliamella]MCX8648733.1 hypothetical protein [Gilliamella sp. B2779]MCX8653391.1 hypothetical protein [Gilliamella sp. B2737]MCX8655667.1 hypothetical protein [Gilliamella sp. B2894]MCX8690545.1 hypothetical protein [Gilliamella sp. B2776]MCX8694748.1 hypothetical protein [Gilliamella sp. B2881]